MVSIIPKETVYLYDENLQCVTTSNLHVNRYQIEGDHGWWLACVRVSQNKFSTPVLYELRYTKDGYSTYKISNCPPKMAKKEEFLENIRSMFENIKDAHG